MSFEILENQTPTVYSPLNTRIDADREYHSLTGAPPCTTCGDHSLSALAQEPKRPGIGTIILLTSPIWLYLLFSSSVMSRERERGSRGWPDQR